jgi:hypothetical protein
MIKKQEKIDLQLVCRTVPSIITVLLQDQGAAMKFDEKLKEETKKKK